MALKGFKLIVYLFGALAVIKIKQAHQIFNLEPIFEWSQLEFKYPSHEERQEDIYNRNFIPGVPAIIDVDVANLGDRSQTYFVTIPRFQAGIPATFGKVSHEKIGNNNIIVPYPNWSWHKNPDRCLPERLISVFRTQIDSCGRLWVLDTGNYTNQYFCPPQILAFNLSNDQVIHRYEIPSSVRLCNSLYVTPVVDVSDGCGKTFVYVADCRGFSLLVHDVFRDSSWNIVDKSMYPDPQWGTFSILGESFELMDGILGMALNTKDDTKRLFFHALSSNTEHSVRISDIRNQTKFLVNPSAPEIFHTYRGRRRSQSPAQAIDENEILYFGDVNEVTLNCWNTSSSYGPANIRTLSHNKRILQFTSGMKVINSICSEQELYIVTSRFQKVSLGTINTNEVNFRVLRLQLDYSTKRFCS